METVNAQQLAQFANLCIELANGLTTYRIQNSNSLSSDDDKALERRAASLLNEASNLNAEAVEVKVSDLTDSVKRIIGSTQKINQALQRLDDISQIIGAVSALINLVTSFITAITTGSPAAIAVTIQNIDNLV